MNKKIIAFMAAIMLSGSVGMFSACDFITPNVSESSCSALESSANENSSSAGGEVTTPDNTTYTFEAEWTDVTNLEGFTYSGGVGGEGMIKKDPSGTGKASNGHFINYLYKKGATLIFEIESDTEVTDAELILRLAPYAFDNITLTWEKYSIYVYDAEYNGRQIKYDDINLGTNVPSHTEESLRIAEFKDYTITTSMHLGVGKNYIYLITNNDEHLGDKGDMDGIAPMVDCIKIKTTAKLTWEPIKDYSTLK